MWMNEGEVSYEVEQWVDHPVLGPATRTLQNLVDGTNACSDGWPYWRKPANAARQLMELIGSANQHMRHGTELPTDEQLATRLKKAYATLRRFRTAQPTCKFFIVDAPGVPGDPQPEPEPLPANAESNSRIFAFIEDLFFMAKIQETARKLNVKVEFVKSDKDMMEKMQQNGEEKPSLIIFDLNNANVKPLTLIPKLKTKLKKTSIIGFLSHVQGDLKQKAHEVGCDMVLPRSAFSQNLPQLLRRHGAPEEAGPMVQ